MRSVKASPTIAGAPGVRRRTACMKVLRRPRLNSWVVKVAVLASRNRRLVSSATPAIFLSPQLSVFANCK
jgi:hypothetical protein